MNNPILIFSHNYLVNDWKIVVTGRKCLFK